MRTTLTILTVLPMAWACSVASESKSAPAHTRSALECDALAAPLEVVIADLVERDELWSGEGDLAVDTLTGGPSGFLSDDQIRGELELLQALDVLGLTESLRAANENEQELQVSRSIDGATVLDSGLRLSEFKRAAPVQDGETMLTNFRGRVRFWEPAVNDAETRALVRFSFGPAPHGACGTYYLERCEDGGWRVVWTRFTYYA